MKPSLSLSFFLSLSQNLFFFFLGENIIGWAPSAPTCIKKANQDLWRFGGCSGIVCVPRDFYSRAFLWPKWAAKGPSFPPSERKISLIPAAEKKTQTPCSDPPTPGFSPPSNQGDKSFGVSWCNYIYTSAFVAASPPSPRSFDRDRRTNSEFAFIAAILAFFFEMYFDFGPVLPIEIIS